MLSDVTTCSFASLRGSWRRVDLRCRDAQQPQQVGSGYAVEVSDADDEARELTSAGEFVGLGPAYAEDLRGGHQVDGRRKAGELANGGRGGVDGILLGELDSGGWLAVRVRRIGGRGSMDRVAIQIDEPDLRA